MRMIEIIAKKRDGFALSEADIHWFVKQYSDGHIPEYQAAALAMAIYLQGMTKKEVSHLTYAMATSGEQMNLSSINGMKVDKHSTGGVGDNTTLVVAPIVASVGVPVAKLSGRGLGHTGGTIDKLEAIPGFQTELSIETFIKLVNKHKLALAGQTGHLTPADKKLYALRDVTGTVSSIPLIASSIMSKKIAAGADAIVLDVKVGSGAFMKEVDKAKKLASMMVEIGRHLGRKTTAVLSDMNQPLGHKIGNGLEVQEAIETLKGEGPKDLTTLSYTLAAHMLVASQKATTIEEGLHLAEYAVASGQALASFRSFVQAQGGDVSVIDSPQQLVRTAYKQEVKAQTSGFITKTDAKMIGECAMRLGAGRKTITDTIDLSAGIDMIKKIGDPVKEGETIAIMYSNQQLEKTIVTRLQQAFTIEKEKTHPPDLIYEHID